MRVLVCIKRVPSPGAEIPLTDGAIDTRHLGFTISPHEECAVEAAVELVEQHGGTTTVLTLGPPAAEEQLRTAIAMGIDHAALVRTDDSDWDPMATADGLTQAVGVLEAEAGPFDLLLFGAESADAGHHQVGIRVATALDRPVVSGARQLEIAGPRFRLARNAADTTEVFELPLPAVATVREGLNLPRYPAMRGRLLARKADIRHIEVCHRPGGLQSLRLERPAQPRTRARVLGTGAPAAGEVVDLLEEVGLL